MGIELPESARGIHERPCRWRPDYLWQPSPGCRRLRSVAGGRVPGFFCRPASTHGYDAPSWVSYPRSRLEIRLPLSPFCARLIRLAPQSCHALRASGDTPSSRKSTACPDRHGWAGAARWSVSPFGGVRSSRCRPTSTRASTSTLWKRWNASSRTFAATTPSRPTTLRSISTPIRRPTRPIFGTLRGMYQVKNASWGFRCREVVGLKRRDMYPGESHAV